MRRRSFLRSLAAGTVAGSTVSSTSSRVSASGTTDRTAGQSSDAVGDAGTAISQLAFDSTSSLLDENITSLTDESTIAVWAHDTARNEDSDESDDAATYGAESIPLVAAEGSIVGFGTMLVTDDDDFSYGNEEFVHNVWDEYVDGDRVVWDEAHDQFYTLSKFSNFRSYAEERGYTVESTGSFQDSLGDADAVVVTSPSRAFTDEEQSALFSFVLNGGAVFLHD